MSWEISPRKMAFRFTRQFFVRTIRSARELLCVTAVTAALPFGVDLAFIQT
jgi:hypothetical protein